MLKLRRITKTYDTGAVQVEALRGIDLHFRPSEFVAVLGPSGCGKTTLLNIIGGLDRYTAGDLFIRGRSTKQFTERDWDAYRNHSVGFVFQSFNLIPHQTALANVALALTLSGVSRRERNRRAEEVLHQVGLGDQIHKRPNEMSGGQMQRVAIARALINDPDILLADEPTGALDSETSRRVLNILKQVAGDRLVIMVTHNAEFAREYASRIVRLQDGLIVDDTHPYKPELEPLEPGIKKGDDKEPEDTGEVPGEVPAGISGSYRKPGAEARRRGPRYPSMSFATALSLSLNNLVTKFVRASIIAFAGSIGITGIGLIIALSAGMQHYVSDPQADILRSFPIVLEREVFDGGGAADFGWRSRNDAPDQGDEGREAPTDAVSLDKRFSQRMAAVAARMHTNDLASFKTHLEKYADEVSRHVTAISYDYEVDFIVYSGADPGSSGGGSPFMQVYPGTVLDRLEPSSPGGPPGAPGGPGFVTGPSGRNRWAELVGGEQFLEGEYDLIAGRWPETPFELVLVIDEENRIPEVAAYDLGLASPPEGFPGDPENGGSDENPTGEPGPEDRITFDEIFARSYLIIPRASAFRRAHDSDSHTWLDGAEDPSFMEELLEDAPEAVVSAIVKASEGSDIALSPGSIGYTPGLTRHVIAATQEAPAVQAQMENPTVNIFTGLPFNAPAGDATPLTPWAASATYEQVLEALGVADEASPKSISIYTEDFMGRDWIADFVAEYNAAGGGDETEKAIVYTDFAEFLAPFSSLIRGISYVLIAFVAISLVVSSIMIGIVSYISVLERTKEIGVLRSLGASRQDVGRVFNAETIIIGFAAGALGVLATVALTIPGNLIIEYFTEIPHMARFPAGAGAALIGASMALTFIAGLIAAGIAARQDPVEALRAE